MGLAGSETTPLALSDFRAITGLRDYAMTPLQWHNGISFCP
jgi:hypothetical protein